MSQNNQPMISKDLENNKIVIVKELDVPLEQVWKAWTESNLLDTWWAPKPWKAKTKTMDFREGGFWLYSMVGPDGTDSWCRVDFKTIVAHNTFISEDVFCDEQGNVNPDFPLMHWKTKFSKTDTGTKVTVEITFDDQAGLEKILEMGFEAGFTSAQGNLEELLMKGVHA